MGFPSRATRSFSIIEFFFLRRVGQRRKSFKKKNSGVAIAYPPG